MDRVIGLQRLILFLALILSAPAKADTIYDFHLYAGPAAAGSASAIGTIVFGDNPGWNVTITNYLSNGQLYAQNSYDNTTGTMSAVFVTEDGLLAVPTSTNFMMTGPCGQLCAVSFQFHSFYPGGPVSHRIGTVLDLTTPWTPDSFIIGTLANVETPLALSFYSGSPVDSAPGPVVGAGLPGLIMIGGSLIALWRRRRTTR